jgi:hypothetical protein
VRVTLIITGFDSAWSRSLLFGSPLQARLTLRLQNAGYQVLDCQVTDPAEFGDLFAVQQIYQARVVLDTLATDPANLTANVRSIVLATTGYDATVSNLTAGQPAPAPLPGGLGDQAGSIITNVASGLQITATAAQALIIVVALGLGFLVFTIAKSPERGTKLLKAL